MVIGDEPRNARKDQASAKALMQGEGGACLPLLPALWALAVRRPPPHSRALSRRVLNTPIGLAQKAYDLSSIDHGVSRVDGYADGSA